MYEDSAITARGLAAAFIRVVIATLIVAIAVAGSTVVLTNVSPTTMPFAFQSEFVDQDPSPTIRPGTTVAYTVRFRNTGLAPWQRGTDKQVTLAVSDDSTKFAELGMTTGWLSATRIATTAESLVLPGTVGTFTFNVRAPASPGVYRIPVRPVVEGLRWLREDPVLVVVTSDLGFHGQLVSQASHPALAPGETSVPLTFTYRNTGARTWARGVAGQQVNLGVIGEDKSVLALASGWPMPDRVAVQTEPSVGPGGIGTFTFRVKAPAALGIYPLRLRLVADGVTWFDGDEVVSLVRVGATGGPATDKAALQPAPTFTFGASVDAASASPGGSVKMTVTFTSSVASSAVLGIEVYAPSGSSLAYQKWFPNESFAAGEQRTYSVIWNVPVGASMGTYSVNVSAYAPGWKTVYGLKSPAATFAVTPAAAQPTAPPPQPPPAPTASTAPAPSPSAGATPTATPISPPTATPAPTPAPAPTFSTSATPTPSTVLQGGSVSVTSLVTSASAASALVDVEIWAPGAAAAAYQVWFDNQNFSAGQQRTYPATWQVPSSAALGTYVIKVGVYAPAWASLYSWNESAAAFTVAAPAATPSPTPRPTPTPTVVPTPTSTPTPVPTPTPAPSVSVNDPSFVYAGTWSTAAGTGKYLSDDHFSDVSGSAFTITFSGTSLRLYSAVAAWHGIGAVSVDGGPESDVDFYAATRQEQALVYATPALANGTHTVRLRVTGRKNAASTGFVVTADRADIVGSLVVPTPTPTPVPTPPPAPTPTPAPPPSGAPSPLHVQGNQLVNAANQPVHLHGVNRAGTEYACIQGWGFIDGPSDAASLAAMKSWRVNAVRVPMNEDCWLAINGAPAAYSGANYQNFLRSWVNLITQNGLYAILELHWTAPGSQQATGQQPMLDADHSVTFWQQVASTFKGNGAVIFEPHNEPWPDNQNDSTAAWRCWRDGGSCSGVGYQAAGMQTIVNTIRGTGATNVIALSGVSYANSLSQWLTYKPSDSLNNLVASWHVYNFNTCNTVSCFNSTVGVVAGQVPVVATEIGVDNCDSAFLNTVMNYLDARQQGYLAWTWDDWGTACGNIALIVDYTGTPTTYGQIYKTHLAGLP